MILKASQRSGAVQLGQHLLKTEENEHVEVCQRRSKSRPFGGVKPGHGVTCRGEWREGVAR
uniref:hypothetical protein n=1 Tax=Edaphosphingomonas laterariae TaxID=861865 RepID=UPI0011819D6D